MFDIQDVYDNIKNCCVCSLMDREKCLRRVDAIDLECDTFIVSQSLAENQLRRSGVNFFGINGNTGSTGKNIERFLNRFGRTVFPPTDVRISDSVVIPKRSDGLLSVYNTEIAQCYPGKDTKGDRKPKREEVANCITKGFLIQEIEVIKPKLLMLMGRLSRDSFFKYVLKEEHPESLSEHITLISNSEIPSKKINGFDVSVLPIQHASGANPEFYKMLKNDKLIDLIKEVLHTER